MLKTLLLLVIRTIHVASICVHTSDGKVIQSETYHTFLKDNILKICFGICNIFTQLKDKIYKDTL